MALSDLERLQEKYTVDEVTGCWVWHAAVSPGPPPGKWPYGIMQFNGKMQMAHRVSYQLHRGPIAEGMQLDHLCRNTRCVNPAHLEPVTAKENIRRGKNPRREQTHCLNGHPLSGDNLYLKPSGRRECRICRAEQWGAFKERHGRTNKTIEEKRANMSSVWIEHNGEMKPRSQWAADFGIPRKVLATRLNAGWPMDEALTTPVSDRNKPKSKLGGESQ